MQTDDKVEPQSTKDRWAANALKSGSLGMEHVPVARPEPSQRLRIAAGYFWLTGSLGLFGIATAIFFSLAVPSVSGTLVQNWGSVAFGAAVCASLIATGANLKRRSRSAGVSALAAFALPLLSRITSGQLPPLGAIVVGTIGLGLIASVWKELDA